LPPLGLLVFRLTIRRPPTSPLFPYTTLFRSCRAATSVSSRNAPWWVTRCSHTFPVCCNASSAEPCRHPTPQRPVPGAGNSSVGRSEEHTSELQSRFDLVCRLLLEKKKNRKTS